MVGESVFWSVLMEWVFGQALVKVLPDNGLPTWLTGRTPTIPEKDRYKGPYLVDLFQTKVQAEPAKALEPLNTTWSDSQFLKYGAQSMASAKTSYNLHRIDEYYASKANDRQINSAKLDVGVMQTLAVSSEECLPKYCFDQPASESEIDKMRGTLEEIMPTIMKSTMLEILRHMLSHGFRITVIAEHEEAGCPIYNTGSEYCTKDSGTNLKAYDTMKTVWNAFMHACQDCANLFAGWGRFICMALPNGAVLPCFEDGVDLTSYCMEDKKFWAIKITWFDFGEAEMSTAIALPRMSITEWWQGLFQQNDIYIPGSNTWFFKDFEGNVKRGTEFTPNKYFGLLTHGVPLVADGAMIGLIMYGLKEIGLFEVAKKFISWVYERYWWNNQYDLNATSAEQSTLTNEGVQVLIDWIDTANLQHKEELDKIKEISNKIGIRFVVGR